MEKYNKQIELLEKWFAEHSKEEILAIFNETDQMNIEGPTYEEYLESLNSTLDLENMIKGVE